MGSFKFTQLIVVTGLALASSFAQATHFSYGPLSGAPLPWPFPWAEECPVDWMKYKGRFYMAEEFQGQQSTLEISIHGSGELRYIRMTLRGEYSQLLARGVAKLHYGQRSLEMELVPVNPEIPSMYASLKLYFSGDNHACNSKNLIPILTVQRFDQFGEGLNHFILLKL